MVVLVVAVGSFGAVGVVRHSRLRPAAEAQAEAQAAALTTADPINIPR